MTKPSLQPHKSQWLVTNSKFETFSLSQLRGAIIGDRASPSRNPDHFSMGQGQAKTDPRKNKSNVICELDPR